jgi:hypothetical protein
MLNPHLRASLHHVLECAQLLGVSPAASAEMARSERLVLGDRLHSEAASSIICLVFVVFARAHFWSAGLWKSPSRHVWLLRGQCTRFGHVASRANCGWSRDKVLQASTATSEAERVQSRPLELWPFPWVVLGTGVLLKAARLHLIKSGQVKKLTLGSVPILATPYLGLRFKSAERGSSKNSAFS